MGQKRETKKASRDLKIWNTYNQIIRESTIDLSRVTKKSIYLDVAELCDCCALHVGVVVRAHIRKERDKNNAR